MSRGRKPDPLEFDCLLGGDGMADAEGIIEIKPGAYNHIELTVYELKDGQAEHDGRYSPILTRKNALALADAIRQHYGVKPDEPEQAEAGAR
jgi:hypothetical protein